MKKLLALILIPLFIVIIISGCESSQPKHTNYDSEKATVGELAPSSTTPTPTPEPLTAEDFKYSTDEYPYDIEEDKKTFDFSKPDIVVGDNLYMTQINDWFMNFKKYDGKSVVIDGFFLQFDNYTFVGRNGPSCPYCTGGYVNFEFKSNEDLSDLVSHESWIRVTGILREGISHLNSSKPDQPFYYIETMKVEKLPKVGKSTITN